MLYILCGNIQTGKTRWLQSLVESLQHQGTICYGVLSPGVWLKSTDQTGSSSELTTYEKVGIQTVLLPEMTTLPFAMRRDLQKEQDSPCLQSERANLGWLIYDEAICKVNIHFDRLLESCKTSSLLNPDCKARTKGLLIVDELGHLELKFQQGFSSALELLRMGPTCLYEHAIVVVRSGLDALAKEQLAHLWGALKIISTSEYDHHAFGDLLTNPHVTQS